MMTETMMPAEYQPKHTDEDMTVAATRLIEMSREVLPDDMRVLIVIVDGCELANKRLRTRMVTNMDSQLVDAVFAARQFDGQVVIPKKHYYMRADPGRYDTQGRALNIGKRRSNGGEET